MRMILTLCAVMALPVAAAAQDYHFTHALPSSGRVQIDNINGAIDVTRAPGSTVEVTVTKTVRSGNGALVRAVMESDDNALRICTVYLNDTNDDAQSCDHNSDGHHHDHLDVSMHYVVHVPDGAHVNVDDVNGSVSVTGVTADAHVETVNGDVHFDGATASSIETTNGQVVARFSQATWDGTMHLETVNGSVSVTFPGDINADVHGETVNGSINSDFPVTIQGKWGPKSIDGRIGSGGHRLEVETVNGSIELKKG